MRSHPPLWPQWVLSWKVSCPLSPSLPGPRLSLRRSINIMNVSSGQCPADQGRQGRQRGGGGGEACVQAGRRGERLTLALPGILVESAANDDR